MARRITAGSSCAEIITTATVGNSPRSAARPISPWLPGMCRSSSTRSVSGVPGQVGARLVQRLGLGHARAGYELPHRLGQRQPEQRMVVGDQDA
jgi:hypothetical protein